METCPICGSPVPKRWIWEREGGPKRYPEEFFISLANGIGVRDALNRMDVELLSPRTPKEVREDLRAQQVEADLVAASKWQAELASAPDPDRSAAALRAWETMRARKANVSAMNQA